MSPLSFGVGSSKAFGFKTTGPAEIFPQNASGTPVLRVQNTASTFLDYSLVAGSEVNTSINYFNRHTLRLTGAMSKDASLLIPIPFVSGFPITLEYVWFAGFADSNSEGPLVSIGSQSTDNPSYYQQAHEYFSLGSNGYVRRATNQATGGISTFNSTAGTAPGSTFFHHYLEFYDTAGGSTVADRMTTYQQGITNVSLRVSNFILSNIGGNDYRQKKPTHLCVGQWLTIPFSVTGGNGYIATIRISNGRRYNGAVPSELTADFTYDANTIYLMKAINKVP